MESLSEDGSFVWTDASNSYSSDDMAMDTGGNSGGDESEYGKSYKKKLHRELFTNENGDVKHERDNKNKKQKRKRDSSGSEHSEITRKKIKVEPKSELDLSRDVVPNGYDENLLDEKVKREQEFLLPTEKVKKRKKTKRNNNENADVDIKVDTDLHRPEKQPSNDSNTEDSSSRFNYDPDDNVTKKKKKKKKSERREETSNVLEEHENNNNSTEKQQNSTSSKSRQKDKAHKKKDSVSDKTADVSRNLTVDTTTADIDISEISKISIVNISQDESPTVHSNKDRRRVSERIQFEDDIIDTESNHIAVKSGSKQVKKQSDKLKRFIESNDKLKVCPVETHNELTIDSSEEVWVMTCPRDVDVSAFLGRSLQLEGRCKVKLGGTAYEGSAGRACGWGALLTHGALRAVRLAGRLALHCRVPRAAPPPAAPAAAPLAARVALPATKRRHPLLGAHYKKALKLPPLVAERLRAGATPTPRASRKRRRGSDPPPTPTPASPPAPAPFKKKSKRKKHDLEADETWASERAIEESLFDF